jgi:hypothetical protein
VIAYIIGAVVVLGLFVGCAVAAAADQEEL